jgi:hypothetical protein
VTKDAELRSPTWQELRNRQKNILTTGNPLYICVETVNLKNNFKWQTIIQADSFGFFGIIILIPLCLGCAKVGKKFN